MGKVIIRKFCIIAIFLIILVCTIVFATNFIQLRNDAKQQLFESVINNDIQKIEIILDKYPSLVNSDKVSFLEYWFGAVNCKPLNEAIRINNFEAVKVLVEHGAKINASGALHDALLRGYLDFAWYFIEQGADITKNLSSDFSAIHYITGNKPNSESEEKELFDLFVYALDKGVSVYYENEYGMYFGFAARSNNSMILEYMLEKNYFDVNVLVHTENKQTALMLAVDEKSYDTCRTLLDYGADITLKDSNGKTALNYAIELDDEKLIAMLSE